jgi:methyl-accepting chemotaxis protein
MKKLNAEAESLSNSAHKLKSTADTMQESGVDQQSAVSEISAAIIEITDMIKSSSDIATQSSTLSKQTSLSAKEGEASIKNVNEAIHAITEAGHDTLTAINGMQESINSFDGILKEIASKTSLINDIVFQTKLLSFNASVEAARAGEHGKGFAVVAEEIGKLAKQSGSSAHDISDIINRSEALLSKIVNQTKEKSQLIADQNSKALSTGNASVSECAALLAKLGSQAEEAYTMSQNILEAYKAQALGAEEILKGIHLIEAKTHDQLEMSEHNKTLS